MPDPISYTARAPRHDLPYLFAGQAQKEFFVNEALARLDSLLHPVVSGELADPPAAPAEGESYIVAANATGAWAGHDGALASWQNGVWLFQAPYAGLTIRDASLNGSWAVFDGQWQRAQAPGLPSGGTMVDSEARAVVAEILAKLTTLGIFSP